MNNNKTEENTTMTTEKYPTYEWVSVSPNMAKQWLDTVNTKNRRIRKWWSNALAQMILRGDWVPNPQPLSFDPSGTLLDGQHRLLAIVTANQNVTLSIAYDVDPRAMKFIDTGVKRTTEDTTSLSSKTAQVARRAATVLYGGSAAGNANIVLEIAQSGVEEVSERLNAYCKRSTKIFCSAPMRLAAVALVMDGYDESEVFSRYSAFANQDYLAMTKAMMSFNRQALNTKANPNDLLARGMKILTPGQKSEGVMFRAGDEQKYIDKVKSVITSAMPARKDGDE